MPSAPMTDDERLLAGEVRRALERLRVIDAVLDLIERDGGTIGPVRMAGLRRLTRDPADKG